MEINDKEELIQRVNGAIGGLTIVLDALTGDYLPETVSHQYCRVLWNLWRILIIETYPISKIFENLQIESTLAIMNNRFVGLEIEISF